MEVKSKRDNDIEAQEHNISEAFKMPRCKKRNDYIKKSNRELHRLQSTKDY